VIPRPRLRLPVRAAIAIVALAYVLRSVVLRGGDFSPDVPGDAVVFTALAVGLVLVAIARRRGSARDTHDDTNDDAER